MPAAINLAHPKFTLQPQAARHDASVRCHPVGFPEPAGRGSGIKHEADDRRKKTALFLEYNSLIALMCGRLSTFGNTEENIVVISSLERVVFLWLHAFCQKNAVLLLLRYHILRGGLG